MSMQRMNIRLVMVCVLVGTCVSHGAWSAGKGELIASPVEEKEMVEKPDLEKMVSEPVKKKQKKAEVKAGLNEEKKLDVAEKKIKEKSGKNWLESVGTPAKVGTERVNSALPCPDRIRVAAQRMEKKDIPAGFVPFNKDVTYWLESVGVTSGVKSPVPMEPYKGTESTSLWRLENNGNVHYSLACNYRNTSVTLSKPLDKFFKSCRVTPATNPQNPHGPQSLLQFSCE